MSILTLLLPQSLGSFLHSFSLSLILVLVLTYFILFFFRQIFSIQ